MTQEITALEHGADVTARRGRAKDRTQFSFFDADDMGQEMVDLAVERQTDWAAFSAATGS